MNPDIKTLPKRQPDEKTTEPQTEKVLDSEIEVIEQGVQEVRLGTSKKFGKDGCGY